MTRQDLALLRLASQRLTGTRFARPEDTVHWFAAMQAQEYPEAKWALSLRTSGLTPGAVDEALAQGTLIRTHVLRPTWHLVLPADLRWMSALTAPRIIAGMASRWRQLELDAASFCRSNDILADQVQGGRHRTRAELGEALERAGISTAGQRLPHLLMRAELDQVLCSGGMRGKQFTYALLDERLPATPPLGREEAIAELARRYFQSHGPAMLQDFAWWSGLTVADAKAGVAMNKANLDQVVVEGKAFWCLRGLSSQREGVTAHLLPNYDEFVVAYKDHSFSCREGAHKPGPAGVDILRNSIVVDGLVQGHWRRAVKSKMAVIELKVEADETTRAVLLDAAVRWGHFMGLAIDVSPKMQASHRV